MKKLALILGLAGILSSGLVQANVPGRHKSMKHHRDGSTKEVKVDRKGNKKMTKRDANGNKIKKEKKSDNY